MSSCRLSFSRVIVFVPILVRRGDRASQARRPFPLMAAAGTDGARQERIPDGAAECEERLGRAEAVALPDARRRRAPRAQRAADAGKRIAELFSDFLEVGRVRSAIALGGEWNTSHRRTPRLPATRAFTNCLTIVIGSGFAYGIRKVPFDVLKPLASARRLVAASIGYRLL